LANSVFINLQYQTWEKLVKVKLHFRRHKNNVHKKILEILGKQKSSLAWNTDDNKKIVGSCCTGHVLCTM
jgi:hypothetical protein